ncbi:MAG TPA: hypothetical protein VFA04_24130 [Bryobacteraceae bacterium]|nr:hypothetical protein [Bryobacteraceae bacterium]
MHRDAIAVLGQVLPSRVGILWALDSVRRIAPPAEGSAAAAALLAVEEWLNDPNDDRRRAAGDLASKAGYGSPAGCIGLAVFLSGGSMGPKDSPGPEPKPGLCGRAISGGISLAVATDPRNAPQHRRAILDDGFRRADQAGIWKATARA